MQLSATTTCGVVILVALSLTGGLLGCNPAQTHGQFNRLGKTPTDPSILITPHPYGTVAGGESYIIRKQGRSGKHLFTRALVVKVDELADRRKEKSLHLATLGGKEYRLAREPSALITQDIQVALENYFLLAESVYGDVPADAEPDFWLRGTLTRYGCNLEGGSCLPVVELDLAVYDRFGKHISLAPKKYEMLTAAPIGPYHSKGPAYGFSHNLGLANQRYVRWLPKIMAEDIRAAIISGRLMPGRSDKRQRVLADLAMANIKQQFWFNKAARDFAKFDISSRVSAQEFKIQLIQSQIDLHREKLQTSLAQYKDDKSSGKSLAHQNRAVRGMRVALNKMLTSSRELIDTAGKSEALNKQRMGRLIQTAQEKIKKLEPVMRHCQTLERKLAGQR